MCPSVEHCSGVIIWTKSLAPPSVFSCRMCMMVGGLQPSSNATVRNCFKKCSTFSPGKSPLKEEIACADARGEER